MGSERGSPRESRKSGGWALPMGSYVRARPRRKEWVHRDKCKLETSTEQPEGGLALSDTAAPMDSNKQIPFAPQDHPEVTPEAGTKASVESEKDCFGPGSPGIEIHWKGGREHLHRAHVNLQSDDAEKPWPEAVQASAYPGAVGSKNPQGPNSSGTSCSKKTMAHLPGSIWKHVPPCQHCPAPRARFPKWTPSN